MNDSTFSLLFSPDGQEEPIVLNEAPSEDALFHDPHPIVITCTEDEIGEILITGVDYDLEALNDERKVDTLFGILNYYGTIDKLLKENASEPFSDVPTFMKSDLKYPEDYTHCCLNCDSEFVSFSLRYADGKKAIMCPKCLQLFQIDFRNKTYQITDEIKAFEKYFRNELEKYYRILSLPIAYNDRHLHKLMSYFLEHSLHTRETLERIQRRGWESKGAYYRPVEDFKIEQFRYFLIDQKGDGFRKRILDDIRMVRTLQNDPNKETKSTDYGEIKMVCVSTKYWNEFLLLWDKLDSTKKSVIFERFSFMDEFTWLMHDPLSVPDNSAFIPKSAAIAVLSMLTSRLNHKKIITLCDTLDIEWINNNEDLREMKSIYADVDGWGIAIRGDYPKVLKNYFNEYVTNADLEEEFEYKFRVSVSLDRHEKINLLINFGTLNEEKITTLMDVFENEAAKFSSFDLLTQTRSVQILVERGTEEWEEMIRELEILDEIKEHNH